MTRVPQSTSGELKAQSCSSKALQSVVAGSMRPFPSNPLAWPHPSVVCLDSMISFLSPSILFGMPGRHSLFPNSFILFHYKVFILVCAGAMSFSSTCGQIPWDAEDLRRRMKVVKILSPDRLSLSTFRGSDINVREPECEKLIQSVDFVFLICLLLWN